MVRNPLETTHSASSSNSFPDATSVWMITSSRERKPRWPLVVAVAFHAVLLMLQLPASTLIEAEPEVRERVTLLPPPRFEPPQPEPERLEPPIERRQAIPDPTPDDPEPLFEEVEIETHLELPSPDRIFEFPEGPPPLPDPGPMLIRGDIEAPVALDKVQPKYPEIARKVRRQGVVVVKAVIDTDGRVVDAKILKSLGFGLDEAALEAALQWRFTPATLHGKPVPVYMNLSVIFNMT